MSQSFLCSARSMILSLTLTITGIQSIAQTVQTYNIDSLRQALSIASSDTVRIWILNNLGRNVANSDSAIVYVREAISLSQKIRFIRGEAEAYNNLGLWFNQKGNYPAALECYLKAIQLGESLNFRESLKRSYNSIATVYFYRQDYPAAISYGRKARGVCIELGDINIQSLADSWIGRGFLGLHQPDSALKYAQEAYELATRQGWPLPLYMSTRTLGDIHESQGHQSLSLEYLRLSLKHARADGRLFRVSDAEVRLGEAFAIIHQNDSAFHHASIAYELSMKENLPATVLRSTLLLSFLYEESDIVQSLKYQKIAMAAKDSLFSQEKNSQVEALNLREALRQRELEVMREVEETNRRNNLQFAAIGIGVVIFVIAFLMISRTLFVSPAIVRSLGVLVLLLVFEFVNLLLAPGIAELANYTPVYMLLLMVIVAGLLIPVHQLLEKKVIRRVIEKNGALRGDADNAVESNQKGIEAEPVK